METSENKNLINFLYLKFPYLHAYQFVGQLKNISETRNDFRAKYPHDERFNILVENSNVFLSIYIQDVRVKYWGFYKKYRIFHNDYIFGKNCI